MPGDILCPPRLRADIILRQYTSGRQQQRKAWSCFLIGWDIICHNEFALATDEAVHMHDRRSLGRVCGHWPLQRAGFIEPCKGHTSKGRRKPRDFVHDFGRVGIVPIQPHRLRQPLRDFPVLQTVHRRHHLAHRLNAAFGIGERAIFFKEG